MASRQPAPDPILVIDDEADLRELLDISLRRMGHEVVMAGSLAEARTCLAAQRFSLVLTDMRLGDGLGIEIVRQLTAAPERVPVAVLTAYGSAENAVEALKAGAFDYIAKPVALDQLRSLILNALGRQQRDPADGGAVPVETVDRAVNLLPGYSAPIQDVRRALARLARSMAPVVISGESGCGKERAARAIHALSARAKRPFVAVNCGAIPETLMESEFFGYAKGAFTGAENERGGFFQAADGGTLLLDEVADLPLAMQVKLLRVLQERRVRKIGASREDVVDVRVMCASHKDLAAMVGAGQFRQDLFYRLNVLGIRMPTLRERVGDIPVLAGHVLEQLAARYGDAQPKRLTRGALAWLTAYAFPGNVRELENLLERAYAFAEGEDIEKADLAPMEGDHAMAPVPAPFASPSQPTVMPVAAPGAHGAGTASAASPANAGAFGSAPAPMADSAHTDDAGDGTAGGGELSHAGAPWRHPAEPALPGMAGVKLPLDLTRHLETVERDLILLALQQTGFNRTAAAPLLGLSFRQLRYRIQQLGIRDEEAGDTDDGLLAPMGAGGGTGGAARNG